MPDRAPREIRVLADLPAIFRAAADLFADTAESAVQARSMFSVALAGGSTPKGLYTLLASDESFSQRIPWANTHVFFGDERCVPPDHADSNYRMARESLLSRVAIPAENIHRMRGEDPDPAAAAASYERELRSALRTAPDAFPRIDLVLLGMGADGHTASLFPGTPAPAERKLAVTAAFVPKLNASRLSLTLPTLNAARAVAFLAAGADKAETLAGVLGPAEPPQHFPARSVAPADGRLTWLVDAAAAKLLPRPG